MLQRHAVEKLHHDEGLAFALADFVDGTDVGMIQSRRSTSLPAEAFERLRVSGNIFRQELEGDKATELRILGLIHNAHSPATELFDNAVVRNGLADHSQECYGGWRVMSMRFGSRYFSFSYSALACFRMGVSGGAQINAG